jgi:hypothetical protein
MFEEALSEVGQFALADAAHPEKRRGRAGPETRHVAQRGVAKQDIGGHAALARYLSTQYPQAFEQSRIDALPRLFIEAGLL